MKGALVCLVALATAACGGGAAPPEVSAAELLEQIEAGTAPVLLDVRSPDEYASGHVPGAVNLPHDRVAERLETIDAARDDELVVYCESGRRAALATEALETAGFSRVRPLEGHMSGWREARLPTE